MYTSNNQKVIYQNEQSEIGSTIKDNNGHGNNKLQWILTRLVSVSESESVCVYGPNHRH